MTMSKEFLNIPPLGGDGRIGGRPSKVPCSVFAMLTLKIEALSNRIKLSVNNRKWEGLGARTPTLMFMFRYENFPSGP